MAWGDPLFDNANAKRLASAQTGTLTRAVINTRAVQQGALERSDADNFLAYSQIPALPETRDEVLELAKILQADAARLPGLRLLPGRFMVIEQAMGVQAGRAGKG